MKKALIAVVLGSMTILLVLPVTCGASPGLLMGDTPFRFVGGFLPGWHWGTENWSEAVDDDLINTARSTGMTVMHLMLPQFENGLGRSIEETALRKLDHFLDSASRANLYVMPSFLQAYSETRIPGNTYYPVLPRPQY